jgi:SAM-dependent methyltransferase
MATITGERVSAPTGGFNPSFQKHVATYRLCAPLLGDGPVLDLGCGIGHSYAELAPRRTVGVDVEARVLAGQDRETHVADMRSLPFADATFASVLSVQSIEHVPDPGRAMAEAARVLAPGGRAIFVTPNRLTFGRPDEIIDPYHYVEFDARELAAVCRGHFGTVEVRGLHGSPRYMSIHDDERVELGKLLAKDPLRLRRLIPRKARQRLYDWRLNSDRATPRPGALAIEPGDFTITAQDVDASLDLVAICDL